jgi:hypothetical protein
METFIGNFGDLQNSENCKYCFTPTKCTIYVRIIKYSINYLKPRSCVYTLLVLHRQTLEYSENCVI